MSMRVCCKKCRTGYLVAETAAGRKFKCRECDEVISVPETFEPSMAPLARKKHLPCPACDTPTLKETRSRSGLLVDVCAFCRGTWLDGDELLELTANQEAVRQGLLVLSWHAAESNRGCPRCQVSMREGTLLDGEIQIDYCECCNGVWFDAGELRRTLDLLRQVTAEDSRAPPPDGDNDQGVAAAGAAKVARDSAFGKAIAVGRGRLVEMSRQHEHFRDCLLLAAVICLLFTLLCLHETALSISELRWSSVKGRTGPGWSEPGKPSTGPGGGGSRPWVHFRYSYSVDSKQHLGFYTGDRNPLSGSRRAPTHGTEVTVFYNPSDPSDSTLTPKRSLFEGWAKLSLMAMLSVLFTTMFILCPTHAAASRARKNGSL